MIFTGLISTKIKSDKLVTLLDSSYIGFLHKMLIIFVKSKFYTILDQILVGFNSKCFVKTGISYLKKDNI